MFFFVVDEIFKIERLIFCQELISVREVPLYYNSFRCYKQRFDLYQMYFGVSGGMLGV
jgi:hypothetical protein